jgi:glyoxylase I family protein
VTLAGGQFDGLAVVFMVKDLKRTERFYADALGFKLERQEAAAGEPPWLLGKLPGNIELVFFEGDVPRGASPQIVFGLGDGGIDDVAEALAREGVEVVTPVSEAPGGWSLGIADPDGHQLGLFQFAAKPRRLRR